MLKLVDAISEKSDFYFGEQMQLLKELVSVDCPSYHLEGNKKIVEILKNTLSKMEAEVEEVHDEKIGTHIVARIKPKNPVGKIIVSAHIDTFTGFKDGDCANNPFRIDGDWAYGIGICDNKAGVVSSLYSVRIAQELGVLPNMEIVMIYNCDEEIGSISSKKIFEQESKDADCAYVFEPARDDNGILTARNGIAIAMMEIKGVTAHPGVAYENGRSAAKELAHQTVRLFDLTDFSNITVDVSKMHSNRGISDEASARIVAAFYSREGDEIYENILNTINTGKTFVDGCTVSIKTNVKHPEMSRTEANVALYEEIKAIGKQIGFEYGETPKSGSGDACLFSSYGVACIDGLGPYMKDIHTVNERMYIPSLTEKTKLFALVLANKQA